MHLPKSPLLTLQFPISYQGSTKCDPSDEGAQVGDELGEVGRRVGSKVRVFDHVLCHAGEYCSQTHQAVEGSYQLGEVGDLNTLSNGQTWGSRVAEGQKHAVGHGGKQTRRHIRDLQFYTSTDGCRS